MKKLITILLLAASFTTYAKETIKIVVPYTAGGTSDKLARQLQTHLTNDEYTFVVENKPGAGGALGATLVANEKSEPTLLVSGQALVTNTLLGNAKYDIENDFIFLSCLITDPSVVIVKADSPIKRFQDIRSASATRTIPYGTSGTGTVQSMVSPLIAGGDKNQIEIPFKGAADVMNALLADTIVWYLDSVTLVSPLIDSGKFRILAASQPLKKYPDVPTFKDVGVDIHGFKSRQLFVGNTALSTKLKTYIDKKLNEEQMAQIFTGMGYESCIDTKKPNALKTEKDIIKRLLK
jgi:tripartite-type tricarboxylate transporter receptor subunit TctC